ncbi:MAG: hypothetical protein SVK08_09675 [Halobacteriota archaeon]|nr:hypothetical protein [Halobacteriota archaeon]
MNEMNTTSNLGNICGEILESLKEDEEEGRSQEEITEDLEISEETCTQILDFMIEFNLIQIDPGEGKIKLDNFGSKLSELPDE